MLCENEQHFYVQYRNTFCYRDWRHSHRCALTFDELGTVAAIWHGLDAHEYRRLCMGRFHGIAVIDGDLTVDPNARRKRRIPLRALPCRRNADQWDQRRRRPRDIGGLSAQGGRPGNPLATAVRLRRAEAPGTAGQNPADPWVFQPNRIAKVAEILNGEPQGLAEFQAQLP